MKRKQLTLAVLAAVSAGALGQEAPDVQAPEIEEVFVTGEFVPDEKRDTSEISNVIGEDDMNLVPETSVGATASGSTVTRLGGRPPRSGCGSPFLVDQKVQLVEQLRYPVGFDPDIVDVFNTNTFTFTAESLKEEVRRSFTPAAGEDASALCQQGVHDCPADATAAAGYHGAFSL